MAIFIVGVKKLNNDRYFRLYNTKTVENNIRDISEKDLIYLMQGNSNFRLQNAELKGEKIMGTTGALDKIANEVCYTVVGSIYENGVLAGYRFVDTLGHVYNMRVEESIYFLSSKPILNASVVNGAFIRGINWEIPIIEDNRIEKANKSETVKHIHLHIDAKYVSYKFSSNLTDNLKKCFKIDSLGDNQFIVEISTFIYTVYVPEMVSKQFSSLVRKSFGQTPDIRGVKDGVVELVIPYLKKGFETELSEFKKIAKECNAEIELTLYCSNKSTYPERDSYYNTQIWNLVRDARDNGINLKKYFFLGTENLVVGNLRGALLLYMLNLDSQLKQVANTIGMKYKFNFNKGTEQGKIKIVNYAPMNDTVPYGYILLEIEKK